MKRNLETRGKQWLAYQGTVIRTPADHGSQKQVTQLRGENDFNLEVYIWKIQEFSLSQMNEN